LSARPTSVRSRMRATPGTRVDLQQRHRRTSAPAIRVSALRCRRPEILCPDGGSARRAASPCLHIRVSKG
jgi:hypothetical protein